MKFKREKFTLFDLFLIITVAAVFCVAVIWKKEARDAKATEALIHTSENANPDLGP